MKRRIFCWLVALLAVSAGARAADLTSSGSWVEFIDSSDLTAGAGSTLPSEFESATAVTTLSVSNASGASWRVLARRTGGNLPAGLTLSVRRTSDGTGSGTISGTSSYVQLSTLDTEIFSGSGVRSDITIQMKLSGMSLRVAPSTYGADVVFTIIELL